MIRIKRVYDPPSADDGERFLVDRLWPRGLTRSAARLDGWLKDLAPSGALRRWFHADTSQWVEFCRRYRRELRRHSEALAALKRKSARGAVTLLYAAHDRERNHAVVLREVIRGRHRRVGGAAPVKLHIGHEHRALDPLDGDRASGVGWSNRKL